MPFSHGVRFEALREILAGGLGAFKWAVVGGLSVLAVYDVRIKNKIKCQKNVKLLTSV